ncbi:MAG: hypothetical protein Ct9H300mP1_22680 [Planctomycetaceae bacterium]|nr:MAG: hypothetical protein Ct9H300mP1_22680 [Planctomycetaceae bacterium]
MNGILAGMKAEYMIADQRFASGGPTCWSTRPANWKRT